MTLLQFIVFILGLGVFIYICYRFVVDLDFPRSFFNLFKQCECPVCHKRYLLPRTARNCCKGTPEYDAWRCEVARKIQRSQSQRPRSYRDMERDCPRCNGQPGNYMCPMCEGRGKTFIK